MGEDARTYKQGPKLNCFMLHINDFVLYSEGNESFNVRWLVISVNYAMKKC